MSDRAKVGRKADPRRREELQEAVVEYVLAHGLSDLSLRPLAEALDTSTYSLVYHFGSKEGVLVAALGGAEDRLRAIVAEWERAESIVSSGDLIRRLWGLFSSEQIAPYLRLFFEVYGLAVQDPQRVPGFIERAATSWIGFLREIVQRRGLPEPDAEAIATLIVATLDGLQLDLITSGDRERTTRALEAFARLVERDVELRARR